MEQVCLAIEWVSEGVVIKSAAHFHLAMQTYFRIKLYLITLSDAHQILARIAFPFPHKVRTGAAFGIPGKWRPRTIPYRTQSEAWSSSLFAFVVLILL